MKYKKAIDYESCRMTWKELAAEYLCFAVICAVIAILFYKSFVAFFCFLPCSYFYVKWRKFQRIEKRKEKLRWEFLEAVKCMASALNAGYSVENAFREAYRDLGLLYAKEDDIMREFDTIIHKIQMNCTAEEALADFAKRSGVEDIRDFSEVFLTAKRTGGDILKIIKNTCRVMEARMEMQREMDIAVAAKKYEAGIMNLVPLGIIAYMWFFSAEFMAPLYHNPAGIIIMTAALLVYIMALFLSWKILKFE